MARLRSKAAAQLKRSKAAVRRQINRFFGHRDYTSFLVLTRSRTGSNWLISMLNSHPAIHAEGEIFQRLKGRSVESILDGLYSWYPLAIRAVGFKIFYYHPLDGDRALVWDRLTAMDVRVMHLKRRNILRTVVSREIAGRTQVWSQKTAREMSVKDRALDLTKEELLHAFTETRSWETTYERLFVSKPLITVYYEDLIADLTSQFHRITDFLGLEFFAPLSGLRRQNPERLSDLITNYESLKRSFADTEWSDFFED